MSLPAQIEECWDAYLAQEREGVRSVAVEMLHDFVGMLTTLPQAEWQSWAMGLADAHAGGKDIPVRMPLFRAVLFPVLLDEIARGSGTAARLLAGFSQLLYHCPDCRMKMPEHLRTEYGLILEAVHRDSKDQTARLRMRQIYRDRFDYALHELPTGVLYEHNGATPEQCDEMSAELEGYANLCSEIGAEEDDTELIDEARFYIPAYKDYIQNHAAYGNFSAYIATDNPRAKELLKTTSSAGLALASAACPRLSGWWMSPETV